MSTVESKKTGHTPLGELCEFIRGVTFDSGDTRPSHAPDYLPILRAGNIEDKLLLEDDLVWVPDRLVSPEQRLRVGDIAICMSSGSADVVGKTARVTQPWSGSVGAFCGIIRPIDFEQSEYMHFWLRSPSFLEWRNTQARGNNIQNLRFSQFASLEIPTPSLSEQKRIAEMLSEQMAAVEKARAAAEEQSHLTSSLPSAILRKWFESKAIESAPEKHIREVCQILSGGTPAKDRSEYWGGSIPWVTVKDMKVRVLDSAALSIAEQAVQESAVKVAPKGAILVLVRGMGLAKGLPVAEIRKPCAFNQDIKAIVSNGQLIPSFLAWVLRYKSSQILSDRQTVTHGTLKLDTEILETLSVPIPSVEVQERIVNSVESEFGIADRAKATTLDLCNELAALPSVLLLRAFSGQL